MPSRFQEFTTQRYEQIEKKPIERLCPNVADTSCKGLERQRRESWGSETEQSELALCGKNDHGDSIGQPSEQANQGAKPIEGERDAWGRFARFYWPFESRSHWQEVVSSVCRVDDGVSNRVVRLKALGNSVVPIQVLRAFEMLMGIE
jgi:hypothetical protein